MDLRLVKKTLHDFALNRAGAPRERREADLGELLLYLMRLADRLGVDLIAAGEKQIQRRGALSLVLVPKHSSPRGRPKT
jgi:hypothetical protein